jgi:hypothetical protein
MSTSLPPSPPFLNPLVSSNYPSSHHFSPAIPPVSNSLPSYWTANFNSSLTYAGSTAPLPREADVVVVGSGLTGTSAVHELVERLLANPVKDEEGNVETTRVIVLEAREFSSGATGAFFSSSLFLHLVREKTTNLDVACRPSLSPRPRTFLRYPIAPCILLSIHAPPLHLFLPFPHFDEQVATEATSPPTPSPTSPPSQQSTASKMLFERSSSKTLRLTGFSASFTRKDGRKTSICKKEVERCVDVSFSLIF